MTITSTVTLSIEFDAEAIRKQTLEAINGFLRTRAQVVMSSLPDKSRVINRLSERAQCTGAPSGSFSPQMESVNLRASVSSNELCITNNNFDFWSEVRGGYNWQLNNGIKTKGGFEVSYVGMDYLINKVLLAGILVESDFLTQNASLNTIQGDGAGWLVGLYLSARILPDLYLYSRAAWGASSNNINVLSLSQDVFHTERSLYNAELSGDWHYNNWRFTPTVGFTYYNEAQLSYINELNIAIPGQEITLGQLNIGPDISYRYLTESLKQITWRLSLQSIYNLNGLGTVAEQGLTSISDGFSGRVLFGTEIRFPSGFTLAPMMQYDGLGSQQFSAVQGSIRINIPLDNLQAKGSSPCARSKKSRA